MKTKLNLPRKKKKAFLNWVTTNWRMNESGGFKFMLNPTIKHEPSLVMEDLFVLYRTIKFNQGKKGFTTKGL